MATITTSTANTTYVAGSTSNAFGYPNASCMDYNVVTGELWIAFRTANTTVAIYKSTDNGVSWSSQGTFTVTGLLDVCGMRVDSGGDMLHFALFTNTGSGDNILYKRLDIRSGSPDFSTGTLTVSTSTSGSQAVEYAADIYARKNEDGSYYVLIAVGQHGSTTSCAVYPVSIKNDGSYTTTVNYSIIGPTRRWSTSGDDTAITVSIDVEHNGDGVTSSKPNVWMSWLDKTTLYCVKATWTGYKTGWSTPSSATNLATGRTVARDAPGRWDGARFIVGQVSTANSAMATVFERNQANNSTTKRTSPAHPVGAISNMALSYNYVTQDLRIFAVSGTSAIYYVDYIRATGTWGSWTTTGWTAPLNANEWGLRRGTYGTNQYDAYVENTGTTPWTVVNQIQTVNFAPNSPTWVTGTAGTPATNGAAFDVSQSLVLDWIFNDPNLTDAQGSYALSRQIGTATIQYWRSSDSTWQPAEVQNTSAATVLTLTTAQWVGAGGASDPAHVYKVKTWDAAGLASGYSSGLSVVPSTRVDPTLTAPTPAQVLNSGTVAVTWTVAEQGYYRVLLTNTTTGATVYDSGTQVDPTPLTPSILSLTVPTLLPDGFAGTVSLTTRNAEGLAGTVRTVNFTVDFAEPVSPTITLVNAPNLGGIQVTPAQVAASGAQPATSILDLYRRSVAYTAPTNTNTDFEVDFSDWNAAFGTVARDNTRAHSGTWSMKITPNGSAASAIGQTITRYPATAGTMWEGRGWLYLTTVNKPGQIQLNFYDVSNTFLSAVSRTITAVAGTWLYCSVWGQAPASATSVRLAIGTINTPAVGDTAWADELSLWPYNPDAGIRIQTGVTAGQTYLDWRAVTGVNYEYRGYAEASNGTIIYGPWVS